MAEGEEVYGLFSIEKGTSMSTEVRTRTDADALQALLERVEKAEGPDRELDALIWTAATGHETHYPNPYMREAEGLHAYTERRGDDLSRWYRVPALTDSIDAAVALVESRLIGPSWSVSSALNARVTCAVRGGARHFYDAEGNTPALALIAALLRALIASEPK